MKELRSCKPNLALPNSCMPNFSSVSTHMTYGESTTYPKFRYIAYWGTWSKHLLMHVDVHPSYFLCAFVVCIIYIFF